MSVSVNHTFPACCLAETWPRCHPPAHPVNTVQTVYTTLQSDHEVKAAVCTKYQAADSSVRQSVWREYQNRKCLCVVRKCWCWRTWTQRSPGVSSGKSSPCCRVENNKGTQSESRLKKTYSAPIIHLRMSIMKEEKHTTTTPPTAVLACFPAPAARCLCVCSGGLKWSHKLTLSVGPWWPVCNTKPSQRSCEALKSHNNETNLPVHNINKTWALHWNRIELNRTE